MRPRIRRIERLESRQLLTAYINEVLFSPLFGDDNTQQYVELRGEPNAALEQGTYLLVVESGKGLNNNEGKVEVIFDLSGLTFGSNGFLVLQQQGSPFTSHPQAHTLKSTSPGFGGLPGDIFSDVHELSDRLDFIYASNTIFLIQSDVAPLLNDDIDTNSDGLVDPNGVFANWDVLDSVSTLWSLNDGYGYGKIVFIDRMGHNPAVTLPPNTTLVELEGTGYVARIGNSTGWAADDWVGGTVKDMNDDDVYVRFAGDVHGRPRPIVFQGRELDSLGSENFTAAAHATFYRDINKNSQRDLGEPLLSDVQILADTNGNGERDLITTTIEPDNFQSDLEINNLTKGVSLSTAIDDNVIIGFDIQVVQDTTQPTGSRIFSHEGIGFFNTSRRFRADFYRPAQVVSIDVIGNSNSQPTYGRLEAFDAQGNSLRMIRTGPLAANGIQTLTIDMGSDVIAYAVAYPDDTYLSSSPFGKLDRFTFSVPEAVSTSNNQGTAVINYLDPDDYSLVALPGVSELGYEFDSIALTVTKYENFYFEIPVAVNEPPVINVSDLVIAENSPANSIVGTITANDDPTQAIQFTLLAGTQFFTLESATGRLRVKTGTNLNFELRDTYVIRVRATDNANSPLSSEREMTVTVSDVNEPPVLQNYVFEAPENPLLGGRIGIIAATDPDAGANGQMGYRITGDNPGQAFHLNDVTGELTVNNPLAFNYENAKQMVVSVQAFDFGDPSQQTTRTVTVNLLDINEPPQIVSSQFSIGELAAPGTVVGRVQVSDPELLQFHSFRWADGFSSEQFEIIESTGDIRVAAGATLNAKVQDTYELLVHVSDSGLPTGTAQKAITISILDENDPPQIDNATLSVAENTVANTKVGTITATDADPDDQLSFAIVGGDGANRFTIDAASGEVRVASGASFDFESQNQWTIVVQVSDDGQPSKSSTRSFNVGVTNVNESPQASGGTFVINENSVGGTAVGTVTFSDPDAADDLTLSIVDASTANLFELDSANGKITVKQNATLDFEGENKHTLTVRVTDLGSLFTEVPITISLANVNEPPQASTTPQSIPVTAAIEFSHTFAESLFVDPDLGQTMSFSLAAHSATWLTFDAATRTLTGLAWNNQVGEHQFSLIATDDGIPPLSSELSFKIVVAANETPWTNPDNRFDVNNRSDVTPADALVIINYLNRSPLIEIPRDVNFRPNYLDVNGNRKLEPIDALQVINFLNRRGQASGEGEGVALSPTVSAATAWTNYRDYDAGLLDFVNESWNKRRKR